MSRPQYLQPPRTRVRGTPPSREVVSVVTVQMLELTMACHLLSCCHLAPVDEMERPAPGNDFAKVQRRRCRACLELEQAREPVRTILLPR